MRIILSDADVMALVDRKIIFDRDKDYSEDEAFELSEAIRDSQIFFSQNSGRAALDAAEKYAQIANKVDKQIDAS